MRALTRTHRPCAVLGSLQFALVSWVGLYSNMFPLFYFQFVVALDGLLTFRLPSLGWIFSRSFLTLPFLIGLCFYHWILIMFYHSRAGSFGYFIHALLFVNCLALHHKFQVARIFQFKVWVLFLGINHCFAIRDFKIRDATAVRRGRK